MPARRAYGVAPGAPIVVSPPDRDGAARRLFVVTPGFEAALIAELPGLGAIASAEAPGMVEAAESAAGAADECGPVSPPPLDPVFARQQLPHALPVHGASVAALAEAAYLQVEAAVDGASGPFTIHAFAPTGAEPALASRAGLIGRELLTRLQQRRRRATRFFQPAEQAATVFGDVRLLIQVLLVARERAWISAAPPRRLLSGTGWDLAPWPAGVAPVADDRQPPSRAYRKLEEAFSWLGSEPHAGEWCVDLGGAPGGWTYTALRRGARVIAVDRAPLEPPVRGHARLTMIEGNAFTYEPPPERVPVDWLLSDVICEPARALAQLQRWLGHGWCRRLVMTIKFKGQTGYGMLDDVRASLRGGGVARWRIKHLQHNKNEVTVMATVR